MKFKIGDKVRYKTDNEAKDIRIIKELITGAEGYSVGKEGEYSTSFWYERNTILVDSNNINNMSITEKFITRFTPEPQKSFRKAGITDGDNMLTDEGQKIFLTWLLQEKHAEDFKKEVVDDLVKELKESK